MININKDDFILACIEKTLVTMGELPKDYFTEEQMNRCSKFLDELITIGKLRGIEQEKASEELEELIKNSVRNI